MKHFENILFVGTGGGNDIFSTTLAMASMYRQGYRWGRCSIAGVISPFHYHSVYRTNVEGFYQTMPWSKRYLLRRNDNRIISFVDARVSEMITSKNEVPYNIEKTFALSLERGSSGIKDVFEQLKNQYDFIVLVDIGGDIFYRGSEDFHILSPFFDATILKGFVDSGANGVLFEAGPGADGEMELEALKLVLDECGADKCSLDLDIVNWWEDLYNKWIINVRPGHTVKMTIEAYRSEQDILCSKYRARAHLGDIRHYHYFDHKISTELCRKFYLIDPNKISNSFAIDTESPFDWFIKTQSDNPTNNEHNLEYWKNQFQDLCQMLTPSPLLKHDERVSILEQGWQEFKQGRTDEVWMFQNDHNLIGNPCEGLSHVEERDKFIFFKR